MLEGYQSMRLNSPNGKISCDVNWNKAVDGCKKIRFKIDNKDVIFDRKELTTMLIALGEGEEIEKLIPVVKQAVKVYKTLLGFEWKAPKDVRKGEVVNISAPYSYTVPINNK